MGRQNITNSSSDSSSASTSGSSSSGSSSSSSGSGSSSSDSDSTNSEAPVTQTPQEPVKSPKPVQEETKKKDEKPKKSSVTKILSSSEEEPAKQQNAVAKPLPARRRSSAKSKTAVLAPAKQIKPAPKTQTERKPPAKGGKSAKTESTGAIKKKSIFSPENSTESESEDIKKNSIKTPPQRNSTRRMRNNSKENEKPVPKKELVVKEVPKRRSGSNTSGPPPKKASASSCTSSQSSTDSDTADSSSGKEGRKKTSDIKSGKSKPPPRTKAKPENHEPPKALTPDKADKPEATMPRKLTRSLSARVSRLATISRQAHDDTDSDNEERVAKAKANEKKGRRAKTMKSPAPRMVAPLELPEPYERRCPVRGCDSSGHLGGKAEKHYTYDACPVYHNVTPEWCVAAAEERAAASVARNKAVQAMAQRPRSQPSIEQRAYQLKVKDMRSKWKGSQEFRDKQSTSGLDDTNEEREPVMDGFVPDYDLKLFREAQALAAINIEEELGDLLTDKGTRFVVMGKYMMEVWYQSPYPGEAARSPRLFVCEFCLNHQRCSIGANRHKAKCRWRHPPGDEVYRSSALSVWQVDGRKHRQYCQQLCLLAKYFLDHKTLYYDVEPFLFYVMTVADNEGCHVVGYFSKEKNSFLNYNVSCILTLPPYQRQGYGRLLIDFSYLLTKVEGKVGSPETPLSDLGLISYRSYWKEALLKRLCSAPGPALCIRDLSKDLAIASCDIVSTLQERGLMKYWKGKHIVLKKQDVLEEVSRRAERVRSVDPLCLRWTPPPAPR